MSLFTHPDFAGGAYDETSFWSARFGALLFEHLELRPNVKGLDVACGTGFPLFELAHVHGPDSHWTGVDVWKDGLERARRKHAVFQTPHVELVEADAVSMPFDDESFDLITSNLGINNFADPPAATRECFRVAKPGARLVVTTNLTGHMAAFYDVFRASVPPSLIDAVDEQEAHRGTRATIEELLTSGGFDLTRVVEDEFFLTFASGTALLRHPLVGFFKDGWLRVTSDESVWASIERKLNDASPLRMRIPMLYAEGVRR
ncbi:MAG TPA: methyltransferase domain-containing protein [Thermoanaerobaculia bacterium]|nr:methyltransferase domain-containing protein [Thermoanaerobaculia bacterium]